MNSRQTVAIVGAGHNGLVCANYLARNGFHVVVFEARDMVGGLCVTEELFEGFAVSSVASYYGMLRPEIIQDLSLEKFGLVPYLTDPAEIILLGDKHYVMAPREGAAAYYVDGIDRNDIEGWERFWGVIGDAARIVGPLYFDEGCTQTAIRKALSESGLDDVAEAIFDGNLIDFCQRYFQNPQLLAAAATCTPGFVHEQGTVYGCIHHGTAQTGGIDGAWGFCRGGMGAVTRALAQAAVSAGVRIKTNARVARVTECDTPLSLSVELMDGSQHFFDKVVFNSDPASTANLLGLQLPCFDSASQVTGAKLHFALNSLPKIPVLDSIGCGYEGIIVIAPAISELVHDSQEIACGALPRFPMMTLAFPSVSDPDCAPAGKHLLTVDVHHVPVLPKDGWTDTLKSTLVKRVLATLEQHFTAFENSVESVALISPDVLHSTYNVATTSCWHLPLKPQWLFENRNPFGLAAYETPVRNAFMCGAGTLGGGNVSGVPGFNCANAVIGARAVLAPQRAVK